MNSIVLRLYPTDAISWYLEGLPDKKLIIGDITTQNPDCVAPWSASSDILVSGKNTFVGLTYPVNEGHAWVRSLTYNSRSQLIHYVERSTSYALQVYGGYECDWFEIRLSEEAPQAVIPAASLDGFWFFDSSKERLLAFGISELDELLAEHNLTLGRLRDIPSFSPCWEK